MVGSPPKGRTLLRGLGVGDFGSSASPVAYRPETANRPITQAQSVKSRRRVNGFIYGSFGFWVGRATGLPGLEVWIGCTVGLPPVRWVGGAATLPGICSWLGVRLSGWGAIAPGTAGGAVGWGLGLAEDFGSLGPVLVTPAIKAIAPPANSRSVSSLRLV